MASDPVGPRCAFDRGQSTPISVKVGVELPALDAEPEVDALRTAHIGQRSYRRRTVPPHNRCDRGWVRAPQPNQHNTRRHVAAGRFESPGGLCSSLVGVRQVGPVDHRRLRRARRGRLRGGRRRRRRDPRSPSPVLSDSIGHAQVATTARGRMHGSGDRAPSPSAALVAPGEDPTEPGHVLRDGILDKGAEIVHDRVPSDTRGASAARARKSRDLTGAGGGCAAGRLSPPPGRSWTWCRRTTARDRFAVWPGQRPGRAGPPWALRWSSHRRACGSASRATLRRRAREISIRVAT